LIELGYAKDNKNYNCSHNNWYNSGYNLAGNTIGAAKEEQSDVFLLTE